MRNRTRIVVALVILLSAVSVGLGAAMMIPSAEELLTSSLETLENVESGFAVVEAAAEMAEESLSATFKVWGALNMGPNGEPAARIEIVSASKKELVGVLAVSDGSQFWLYDPNRNTVVVGRSEEMATILAEKMAAYGGQWPHDGQFDPEAADIPETPTEAVAKLLEFFTATRQDSETLAGGDAYLVRLAPIPEQMPDEVRMAGGYLNLWLSTSDQLPLAIEYAQGALGWARIEATEVRINEDLGQDVFTFAIPADAEVIEAADLLVEMEARYGAAGPADFEPLTATDLPDGAVAAEMEQIGGRAIQRYNLPGGRSFVVAQGPVTKLEEPAEAARSKSVTVRGVAGTLFANEDDTRVLLGWVEGDTLFVVAGDLTSEQALAIAESLQ